MKQYTRVISKPEGFPAEAWDILLSGLALLTMVGEFHRADNGVCVQVFIDLQRQKVITTIIHDEQADADYVTKAHQFVENTVNKLNTLPQELSK